MRLVSQVLAESPVFNRDAGELCSGLQRGFGRGELVCLRRAGGGLQLKRQQHTHLGIAVTNGAGMNRQWGSAGERRAKAIPVHTGLAGIQKAFVFARERDAESGSPIRGYAGSSHQSPCVMEAKQNTTKTSRYFPPEIRCDAVEDPSKRLIFNQRFQDGAAGPLAVALPIQFAGSGLKSSLEDSLAQGAPLFSAN